jgi:HprK-related kinase A
VARVTSQLEQVAEGIALHYADHSLVADDTYADFHVSVERPRGVRRWLRQQVVFKHDSVEPFAPLPGNQGFPLLEWGLNWCVSAHCHEYLILHSAVIERGGRALLLPAPSGWGKSTLCAGLVYGGGWRLLSDELALIEPCSGKVVPMPRPVSLKNGSIDVIRRHAPSARFGAVVSETVKGSVSHVRPPKESVTRAAETARPAWVVLPRYEAKAPAELRPLPKAKAFMALVSNAFNYNVHREPGFNVLAHLVSDCDCHEFVYSDLDEARGVFDRLHADE